MNTQDKESTFSKEFIFNHTKHFFKRTGSKVTITITFPQTKLSSISYTTIDNCIEAKENLSEIPELQYTIILPYYYYTNHEYLSLSHKDITAIQRIAIEQNKNTYNLAFNQICEKYISNAINYCPILKPEDVPNLLSKYTMSCTLDYFAEPECSEEVSYKNKESINIDYFIYDEDKFTINCIDLNTKQNKRKFFHLFKQNNKQ